MTKAKPPWRPWLTRQPNAIQRAVAKLGGAANVKRYRWTSEEAKVARRRSRRHPVKEGE